MICVSSREEGDRSLRLLTSEAPALIFDPSLVKSRREEGTSG